MNTSIVAPDSANASTDDAWSRLADLVRNHHEVVTTPLLIVVILLVTWFITRISKFVVHRLVARLSRRALAAAAGIGRAPTLWRTRARRTTAAEPVDVTEQRRNQRVEAAATMVNHLISVIIWFVAVVVIFNVFDINAAYYLTSAGFLGAALAFGGQHKVNDYLTGLSVLFEDRYGVGDLVEFRTGADEPVQAVVDHVGLFSTRLRDAESTLHMPNATLAQVRNISQEPATAVIRVKTGGRSADRVVSTVKGLAGTSDLTRVVFLGDLVSEQPSTGEVEIGVHTLRPLDRSALETLTRRAEEALTADGVDAVPDAMPDAIHDTGSEAAEADGHAADER